MAENKHLYLYSDSSSIPFGDHTWVSSYATAFGEPNPELGYYWYCNGDPHENGSIKKSGKGGVEFACFLAKSDDKDEKVGIVYMIDGVCHQMTNRLLKFSIGDDGKPVTLEVGDVRGYNASVAAYGVYGEKPSFLDIAGNSARRYKDFLDRIKAYKDQLNE